MTVIFEFWSKCKMKKTVSGLVETTKKTVSGLVETTKKLSQASWKFVMSNNLFVLLTLLTLFVPFWLTFIFELTVKCMTFIFKFCPTAKWKKLSTSVKSLVETTEFFLPNQKNCLKPLVLSWTLSEIPRIFLKFCQVYDRYFWVLSKVSNLSWKQQNFVYRIKKTVSNLSSSRGNCQNFPGFFFEFCQVYDRYFWILSNLEFCLPNQKNGFRSLVETATKKILGLAEISRIFFELFTINRTTFIFEFVQTEQTVNNLFVLLTLLTLFVPFWLTFIFEFRQVYDLYF